MAANDPRQITAKFNSQCKSCGKVIRKGEQLFYWPLTKTAKCTECGEADYRVSMAAIQDEENYCR